MQMAVFLISLFGFMALGVPIGFVLVLCGISLMFSMNMFDPMIVAQNMVAGANSFPLMAIPFFMLAGEIMAKGGLSIRIVRFAKILVGRVRGGLGYAAIIASIVFSGLSGSAVADAAALGGILVPLMVANGYKPSRAVAFICAGAIIAPVIPPSIPMIVMGTATNLSITKLFMGGLIPGVIIAIALMVVWFFVVRIDGYEDQETFTRQEIVEILKDSIPALVMPIMIVGGIRLGIFTPTEAGAFAVVYAILICSFFYREFTLEKVGDVFVTAVKSTAVVMLVVAAATSVSWFITVAQIPRQIAESLGGLVDRPLLLLLVINLFLMIMGMIMDCTPNILIFAPVLLPVATAAGIDPYYFAILMNINLCIGLATPPVGVVLYVGASTGKVPFGDLCRSIVPFLAVEVAVLVIMILFPALITVPLGWLT